MSLDDLDIDNNGKITEKDIEIASKIFLELSPFIFLINHFCWS